MRTVSWLTLIWVLASIVAGLIGDRQLVGQWQAGRLSNFERDIRALRAILQATEWTLPLESDARWIETEELLELKVVPSLRSATEAGTASAFDAPKAPVVAQHSQPGEDKTWDGGPVTLTALSAGGIRLSRVFSMRLRVVSDPNGSGQMQLDYWIRSTREVASQGIRANWWWLWSSYNACGLGFAAAVFFFLARQTALERSVLTPWLAATQLRSGGLENGSDLLPKVTEIESRLEPPLSLIADRVNRLVIDLHNANERSDLVLGNLQEGVLAVDDRSRILLANSAFRQLLGLGEEPCIDRPLLEVVRVPSVTQLIERVLTEQISQEATIEHGTASRKSLQLLARPLRLTEDRGGALLTVRDRTLINRIESVRRDFVANASHELKTPLAAIRAYAETLQMGALDNREEAEQFVACIIEQADRINSLVQGMLQLSRVQAGGALRIETFDAADALTPCIAAADAMARSRGISLVSDLVHPQMLRSDRDGFQTIVSNLLSNAVRYTHEGGSVKISTRTSGAWYSVTVTDTGIGIHPADLERIFERFYRAEKDRATNTGGTGLGLSIVKNLVQALHGTVTADSEPNSGSRFEVRLPLAGR